MTGIAGLWGDDSTQATTMLDALGPRAAHHRSGLQLRPNLRVACGYHAGRRGGGTYERDGYAVVVDGRIETDAGAPLSEPGQRVIDAYRAQGIAGFAGLHGDFAFVLWDPERLTLICARDAVGSRPLFYHNGPNGFAFASEERGLQPLFGDERLDEARIAEFLGGIAPPAECGLRASVRRVPPGVAVVARSTGVSSRRFDVLALPPVNGDAVELQAERFRTLLEQSVRKRCAGEAAVDCFLSGGLDSSSLARLAAIHSTQAVRTLSVVDLARPDRSEQAFIDEAAAVPGIESRAFDIGNYDPFAGAEDALIRHAGPFVAPNLLMMQPLYRATRAGAVLLDGHGGDEVVSKGTGRLLDLARSGRWITLVLQLRGVADLYGESPWTMLAPLYRGYGPGRYKLDAALRAIGRILGDRAKSGFEPLDLLNPAFRARSGVDDAQAARRKPKPETGRALDHSVLLEPQQTYALEILDREAQDAGVELQCPFWDRALIDYSMSLPPEVKLKGGWTRFILRKAMADVLPPKILWRRDKHDFAAQLRDGLCRSPVVSLEGLSAARVRLAPHLDVDQVMRLRASLDDPTAPVTGAALQALWRVGLWSIWSTLERASVSACSLNGEPRDVPN